MRTEITWLFRCCFCLSCSLHVKKNVGIILFKISVRLNLFVFGDLASYFWTSIAFGNSISSGSALGFCGRRNQGPLIWESGANKCSPFNGSGDGSVAEQRTRDRTVSGGRIFFSEVKFLCLLLFLYPFHPRVASVGRKRSRSFCQKCRWLVTDQKTF